MTLVQIVAIAALPVSVGLLLLLLAIYDRAHPPEMVAVQKAAPKAAPNPAHTLKNWARARTDLHADFGLSERLRANLAKLQAEAVEIRSGEPGLSGAPAFTEKLRGRPYTLITSREASIALARSKALLERGGRIPPDPQPGEEELRNLEEELGMLLGNRSTEQPRRA